MTLQIGKLDLSPESRKATWTDGGKTALHRTHLLQPDPDKKITPNAFLVEQASNSTVRSHFHVTSQFQVFVGGSGTLGRKPVQGYVAQYVAPHTGYGPIEAGPHGLWYLTLRPSAPSGARYLPEARAQLDMTLPKKQVTSAQLSADTQITAASVEEVIAPQADGLAGWKVNIPPGESVPSPAHPGGLARYYVVATGELLVSGERLGPFSLAWDDGDELAGGLQAGPRGASVLVLQFPGNAY